MKHQSDTSAARADVRASREFYVNPEIGRSRSALTDDIREVNAEARKRGNNQLTNEDQNARRRNLRTARARIN